MRSMSSSDEEKSSSASCSLSCLRTQRSTYTRMKAALSRPVSPCGTTDCTSLSRSSLPAARASVLSLPK